MRQELASALAAAAAARQLLLFLEPARTVTERAELCSSFDVTGWMLREEEHTSGEWSGDEAGPPLVRILSAEGRSAGCSTIHASPERTRRLDASVPRRLLRVSAPESAVPGLNWALGLDAARVLECSDGECLDWLLSVEADELDDIVDRVACGVHGSHFQTRGAVRGTAVAAAPSRAAALRVQPLPLGAQALVLPEACRGAAVAGALPPDTEPLWRVTPSNPGAGRELERCLRPGDPYWVTTSKAADAVLLARSLPHDAIWVAHLDGRNCAPLGSGDVARLREAGCSGLALAGPQWLRPSAMESLSNT